MKKQVYWICRDCGLKYGKIVCRVSTMHKGKCEICGKEKAVTEGRDFGVHEVEIKEEL